MDILIKSRDAEISNTLKKEIERKLQRACKIYSRSIDCDVILFKEKDDEQKNYCIEARLVVPRTILFAKERGSSFENALDRVTLALRHQLVKYKEKLEEV